MGVTVTEPVTVAIVLSCLFLFVLCNCIVALPVVIQFFVGAFNLATSVIALGAQMGRYIGVHFLSVALHVFLLPILLITSLLGGFLVGFLRRVLRLVHAIAWGLCGKFLKEYIALPPTNGLGGPIVCSVRAPPLPSPPLFIGHDFYFSFLCCCSDPFSTNSDLQCGGLCRCCDENRCKNRFRGTDYDKEGFYRCSCCWSPLQKVWTCIFALMAAMVVYGLGSSIAQFGVGTLFALFVLAVFAHIPVGFLAVLVAFPFYTGPLYTSLPIALERAGALAGSALGDVIGWIIYFLCCFTLECRQLGNRRKGGISGLCLQLLKGGVTSTLPAEVYLNEIKEDIVMGRPKEGPLSDLVPGAPPTPRDIYEDKKIVTANPLTISAEEPVIISVDQDQVGVWQMYKTTGLIEHVENFSKPSANSLPLSPAPIIPPPPGGCGYDCNAPAHTGLCLRCEKDWAAHNHCHVCAGGGRGSWLINESTPTSKTAAPSKLKLHWIPEHFRSNHGNNEYSVKCVGEVTQTRLPKWIKQLENDAINERTKTESQPEVYITINSDNSHLAAEKTRLGRTLLALKEKPEEVDLLALKEKPEEVEVKSQPVQSSQTSISISLGSNVNATGSSDRTTGLSESISIESNNIGTSEVTENPSESNNIGNSEVTDKPSESNNIGTSEINYSPPSNSEGTEGGGSSGDGGGDSVSGGGGGGDSGSSGGGGGDSGGSSGGGGDSTSGSD